MPLQATSGAASYDAFGGGVAAVPNYIEDVFSTWLYTGNGSTQTINNGIDLAGKGGLVWFKRRDVGDPFTHELVDTVQGTGKFLSTPSAAGWGGVASDITSFNTNGFSINDNTGLANNGSMVSWTFRKAPKFFDVVTYTGNGVAGRTVAHNLGSVPGVMIVKSASASGQWPVYHRSTSGTPQNDYLLLNQTAGAYINQDLIWNNTAPTSTVFTVGNNTAVNANGVTYVAYLFAHNAGGFGLTGTDNVISCGSFTTDGSGNATVNLGYEPQWVMVKQTNAAQNWYIEDNMRAFNLTSRAILFPNLSNAEATGASAYLAPNATGFSAVNGQLSASATYIYIAIRRGPMKVPTTGTSVFAPAFFGTNGVAGFLGAPADMNIQTSRTTSISTNPVNRARLLGGNRLTTSNTNAEVADATNFWDNMTGMNPSGEVLSVNSTVIDWTFRRAPGFFDVCCYTGTGTNQFINHNLGVRPDLYIVKRRSATANWAVTVNGVSGDSVGLLNSSNAFGGAAYDNGYLVNGTVPASNFGAGFGIVNNDAANASGSTYVAYLFASVAGVSRVGSYTGNGSSQTINCGFTGGARFVMVKRTDATGNWLVVDTARGLVAAGDPTLYLNSTAAEVTGADWIDPDSSGFIVNQEGTMNANVNAATYIFLAIA